ncbi:lipopolysaccharide heptosyltransferase II [Chlamydiales bacterium]|nr:lipopolysaccharide heptosyltransferase II [Chlamydiales bacterium]
MQIIIRMPNWFGDAVMGSTMIEDIKRAYPNAKITLMCQGMIGELFMADPNIEEIYRFKKVSGWIHQGEHRKVINPIIKGEFDTGLLLTGSFSSACWFFRGKVKKIIGFNVHYRRLFLTNPVPFPKEREKQHHVDTYRDLLIPLGIPHQESVPKLYITEEEKEWANKLLEKHTGKVIGINPGAAFGSAKCWPPERFRALVEKILKETDHTILCFGDSSLVSLINQITHGLGERVVNLAGKTSIRELLALINACDVFLSNDSGPMHIAAALKVPLVALFGSTNPTKTGPYHFGKVIYKKVFCSPCYKRICPIDFSCMKNISVDEVYSALLEEMK